MGPIDVAAAFAFVAANFVLPAGLQPPDEHPVVHMMPADELQVFYWNGNEPRGEVHGFTHFDTHEIYLGDELTGADLRGMLVHEMVHYFQLEAGIDFRVEGRGCLEKPAYDLQERWVVEVEGEQVHWDPFTKFALTICMPDK